MPELRAVKRGELPEDKTQLQNLEAAGAILMSANREKTDSEELLETALRSAKTPQECKFWEDTAMLFTSTARLSTKTIDLQAHTLNKHKTNIASSLTQPKWYGAWDRDDTPADEDHMIADTLTVQKVNELTDADLQASLAYTYYFENAPPESLLTPDTKEALAAVGTFRTLATKAAKAALGNLTFETPTALSMGNVALEKAIKKSSARQPIRGSVGRGGVIQRGGNVRRGQNIGRGRGGRGRGRN